MRIQDFNPVLKEDNEMSDVVTAHGLMNRALTDQEARQEYFEFLQHLRNKHGKDYSTRIHQKASTLAKSTKQKEVDETIVKVGSQYELKSHTGKNLGKYPTKAGAKKREQQVNYFKHVNEDAWTGENPAWGNSDPFTGENPAWGGGSGGGAVAGAVPVDEDFNPQDVVSVDVPLLIRLLEYAREDAKTDMDLHDVTERLIALSQEGNTLTMQDYDTICNTKETD